MRMLREVSSPLRNALARRARPTAYALAAAVACGVIAAPASADPVEACLDAHSTSQSLRMESKLLEARKRLLVCAAEVCPEMVRKDCAPWLDEVNGAIPSVVFVARKSGRDLAEVNVYLDGTLLVSKLDGRPVEIDPGPHKLRFETAGSNPIDREVVIRVGQRSREEVVDFVDTAPPVVPSAPIPAPAASSAAPAAPVPVATHRPVPVWTWVFGGVGLAALTVGTVFELRGMSIRRDLDDEGCKPYCSKSDVDSGERSVLTGDIALGLGVASLGVAAFTYFTRPEKPIADTTVGWWRPRLLLDARPGGGTAGLAGTF